MAEDLKYTPPYHKASKILEVVEQMQKVERERALDRALIDGQFNGGRPYTKEEQENLQIFFNVNWGEGRNLLIPANTQVNSALIYKRRFFRTHCIRGPVEKREEYSETFAKLIHKPLKRGKSGSRHMNLLKNRNASLTLHGVGPMMWMNDYDWLPRFIPLEDLLIPTGTDCDFGNLTHFAVNIYYTPYQFFELAEKGGAKAGWNMKMVHKILSAYRTLNVNPYAYDWLDKPEMMAELWKQNRVPCDEDSVPKIHLTIWFFRATKSTSHNERWYRKIVFREIPASDQTDPIDVEDFVFESPNEYANSLGYILHCQFGDCSLVPPLKYHSVRGLGVSLYSIVESMNRVRCQFAQHVMEQFVQMFRIDNPADRDRPHQVQLMPYGVVEQGVQIIPQNERHQINPNLVDQFLSYNRQLLSESGASYVQDIQRGQQGNPITATEAQIRLQSVNIMVSAMMMGIYTQETAYYEELKRRFLNRTSEDPDVKVFQSACQREGIPSELMVPDAWEIETEMVMGGGDQLLAEKEATQLLQLSRELDPKPQRIVKRLYINTISRNPSMGELLVPEDKEQATAGRIAAERTFGTLMTGVKASLPEGIEREDYIEAMLQMIEATMQSITETDNVGTPEQLRGLQAAVVHTGENIQALAMDENKTEQVKMYEDALGQLENLLKGFAQRLAEQAGEKQDPAQAESEAKIQTMVLAATTKAKIAQSEAMRKMQQSQAEFAQQLRQMEEKHSAEMAKIHQMTQAELVRTKALTKADIAAKEAKAKATETGSQNLD